MLVTVAVGKGRCKQSEKLLASLRHGCDGVSIFDDIGSYSGFKNQDENKPFIFYGGGFDDKIKYVGVYTAICNGIVPLINEHVQLIYKIDPQLTTSYDEENYFPFNAFPSTVSINNTISHQTINCEVYPTNWVSNVKLAQKNGYL